MKKFRLILALGALAAFARPAAAQISIDEVNAEPSDVKFHDELKSTSVDVDYFSLARYRAERAAIRKERNDLEISAGLQGTLTSYNDPWISVSGGDNSIALVASFNLRHLFKKNLFSIETKASAKPWLKYVQVPLLLLNAKNDPFMPQWALPTLSDVSDNVWLDQPEEGGHVGFPTGNPPGKIDYLPKRIFRFFLERR